MFPDGVAGVAVRWIEVDGLRARCVEAGDPLAPALVMLPGWGCTAYTFRGNVPAFAAAGWRTTIIEPPGQGWSDKPLSPGDYTLTSLAQRVVRILDLLDIGTVPVVGQSLGGGIALQLALTAPDRVARLALWSPIGFGCAGILNVAARLPVSLAPVLERVVGPGVIRRALQIVYGPAHPPTDDDVREYFAPIRSSGFVRAQIALLRNVDWRAIPEAIRSRLTLPILIVTGTSDPIVPFRCLDDAARTLPNARLYVVPGAGHAANETHPEQVNRETLGFVCAPDGLTTS